ncbi:MAG: hypothetical protein HQ559_09810 [Lentisphaerae bacterium]|nr:hypothetical protein [Lentisphaerota bacterium]
MRTKTLRIWFLLIPPALSVFILAASVCAEEGARPSAALPLSKALEEQPGEEDPAKKLEELRVKLITTKRELAGVQERVDEVNKKFYRFQHDVVYTNAGARRIYEDIHRLEVQLKEKREELNRYLVEIPQMRDVMSERRSVFGLVGKLRDKEMLIRKEIRAARWRMAGATGDVPAANAVETEPREKPAANEIGKSVAGERKPIAVRQFVPSDGPRRKTEEGKE